MSAMQATKTQVKRETFHVVNLMLYCSFPFIALNLFHVSLTFDPGLTFLSCV